jgi:hypothetical protein
VLPGRPLAIVLAPHHNPFFDELILLPYQARLFLDTLDKIWFEAGKGMLADGREVTSQGQNLAPRREDIVGGDIISRFQPNLPPPGIGERGKLGEGHDVGAPDYLHGLSRRGWRYQVASVYQKIAGLFDAGILSQAPGVGDFPENGGSYGSLRTGEVHLVACSPTAARKIPGESAHAYGTGSRRLANTDAAPTPRWHNAGPCFKKGKQIAGQSQVLQNLAGARVNL